MYTPHRTVKLDIYYIAIEIDVILFSKNYILRSFGLDFSVFIMKIYLTSKGFGFGNVVMNENEIKITILNRYSIKSSEIHLHSMKIKIK